MLNILYIIQFIFKIYVSLNKNDVSYELNIIINRGEQMRTVVLKYITLSVLIIIGVGGYCQADTNTKSKKASNDELPNMKLKVAKSTSSNPKLKKGKGCENLEEVQGETFDDYPMAQTVPCDKVDCKNLKPAVLHEDKYKDLPTAKTDGSCDE